MSLLTKKRVISLIVFFSVLLLVFILMGFFNKVFADIIAEQSDYSALTNVLGTSLYQTFGVLTGTATQNLFRIQTTENSSVPQIIIWKSGNPDVFFTGSNLPVIDGLLDTLEYDFLYNGNSINDYVFDGASEYKYSFQGFTGNFKAYGSTDPDSYSNGACGGGNCGDVADIYFRIGTLPVPSLQIDFPESATSTPDFNYWGVSGYSNIAPAIIHINWGTSTSTWSGFSNYILDDIDFFDVSASKSFVIPLGSYYATAWLAYCPVEYDLYADCIPSTWEQPYGLGLFTPFATSTTITFTITGENPYTGGYYGTYYPEYTPTSTATSSEWVITCDPNDPLWSRSICQISKWTLEGLKGLLQFLFVPKQEDLTRFGELKAHLELKPPLGYFYIIKNAWQNNLSSTSTPAFVLESATSTLNEPIYEPIKTGFTWILWLSAGVFVFNRIRHFIL